MTVNPCARFPTTSWTLISAAGSDSASSAIALSELCSAYFSPVYAFIRRKGYPREEAEDLTQAFFTRLLERGTVAEARRDRGRFRSFLLASVSHFLSNERDRSVAQKRGGGFALLSLDFDSGEDRYCREPAYELTPEAIFERQWALALLDRVLDRLCAEYRRRGRQELFECLKASLAGDRDSYAYAAETLGLSEGAVRTALHRLRRRYAEMIRDEVAGTVADPAEVDSELRFLFGALHGA